MRTDLWGIVPGKGGRDMNGYLEGKACQMKEKKTRPSSSFATESPGR